ncbi:FAD:protein FMN transferase [Aurantimonas sp. C2-6-R+9]|uniref:FAD:protein FMN transferase n=1 Tax=unclassified Aurantimonas TaxID=2638230 RepID=UPI002E199E0A|nr:MULTISPECIES: FAD:protein FMN transferase [unclassified Aurantimonas]MEC5290927.1 FAD:protein FMN transferase [Aurantimonas sp. C2-3-R2]MEC5325673.1 FAD:protein FMN transferase [Aurantimonas sp. A3-2-R12]MEC5381318.1 FAD:protein FMN transferase [Aurantimonas sp. C2-6-R+9]MEC5412141.1 FAD:protein FMN transferase [Aurantimonas sp. C2-4-R8]
MTPCLTRRRFMTICAAAALPREALAGAPMTRWRGAALGAEASMTLVGIKGDAADEIFAATQAEIDRLEGIFSLYRAGSALARLNLEGRLDTPPAELVELLALSDSLHRVTGGAFDPTIQPLWQLHALAAQEQRRLEAEEIAEARKRTGWVHLRHSPDAVGFRRDGMALTLNGIAQGYIADRVAALVRARGLTDVLIDMGEIAALGRRPDRTPWRAAIATPDGEIVGEVPLGDRALATSAPLGTPLDKAGRVGHILDPRTGHAEARWRLVSVAADSAALADGLSTAFCLMPRHAIKTVLQAHPNVSLEAIL